MCVQRRLLDRESQPGAPADDVYLRKRCVRLTELQHRFSNTGSVSVDYSSAMSGVLGIFTSAEPSPEPKGPIAFTMVTGWTH